MTQAIELHHSRASPVTVGDVHGWVEEVKVRAVWASSLFGSRRERKRSSRTRTEQWKSLNYKNKSSHLTSSTHISLACVCVLVFICFSLVVRMVVTLPRLHIFPVSRHFFSVLARNETSPQKEKRNGPTDTPYYTRTPFQLYIRDVQ